MQNSFPVDRHWSTEVLNNGSFVAAATAALCRERRDSQSESHFTSTALAAQLSLRSWPAKAPVQANENDYSLLLKSSRKPKGNGAINSPFQFWSSHNWLGNFCNDSREKVMELFFPGPSSFSFRSFRSSFDDDKKVDHFFIPSSSLFGWLSCQKNMVEQRYQMHRCRRLWE